MFQVQTIYIIEILLTYLYTISNKTIKCCDKNRKNEGNLQTKFSTLYTLFTMIFGNSKNQDILRIVSHIFIHIW